MKQTMEFYDFRRILKEHRPDNFTDDGLWALWQHLEELEDETGVEMNFNLTNISCSYAEYASPKEHAEEASDYDHVLVATTATGGLIVRKTS
jgi:protoporphyrinogen oxidase